MNMEDDNEYSDLEQYERDCLRRERDELIAEGERQSIKEEIALWSKFKTDLQKASVTLAVGKGCVSVKDVIAKTDEHIDKLRNQLTELENDDDV